MQQLAVSESRASKKILLFMSSIEVSKCRYFLSYKLYCAILCIFLKLKDIMRLLELFV